MSRAAVFFAGAAVLGCDQGTPPPPAKPAPQTETTPALQGPGRVRGVVRDTQGTPLRGANVMFYREGAGTLYLVTDEQGQFDQRDLAPGSYRMGVEWAPVAGGGGSHAQMITVSAGTEQIINVEIQPQPHMIEGKPYGAPPARRRVV